MGLERWQDSIHRRANSGLETWMWNGALSYKMVIHCLENVWC